MTRHGDRGGNPGPFGTKIRVMWRRDVRHPGRGPRRYGQAAPARMPRAGALLVSSRRVNAGLHGRGEGFPRLAREGEAGTFRGLAVTDSDQAGGGALLHPPPPPGSPIT